MRKGFAMLRVRSRPGRTTQGWLSAGGRAFVVALGRTGIRADKREGDGATPRGCFHPRAVWWRADRGPRPRSPLPVRRIAASDGWCEDPTDRRYNRRIRLTEGAAGDRLVRADHLYDLIVELDHNTRPRIARRGSAVFIHVARRGYGPTAGCIALEAGDLRRLLGQLSAHTRIDIR